MDKQSLPDQSKQLFVGMVSMFTMSAMQQLGKIINPATGKAAVSLEEAQITIDMLNMLEIKTRGNLDQDETKVLKDSLTMLQLNYVDVSKAAATAPTDTPKKQAASPAKEKTDEKAPAAASDAQDSSAPQTNAQPAEPPADQAPSSESKEPKFRKSYG